VIVVKREILVYHLDALDARLNGLMKVADLAIDENFAVRGWKIPGNQLDQGGLAGTIVTHQPHDLAGLDRPADVVDRVDSAKTLRYVTNFQQSHPSTSLSCSSSGCPANMQRRLRSKLASNENCVNGKMHEKLEKCTKNSASAVFAMMIADEFGSAAGPG